MTLPDRKAMLRPILLTVADGNDHPSTRIREAIRGSDIRSANAMLGRPHAMDGVIVVYPCGILLTMMLLLP